MNKKIVLVLISLIPAIGANTMINKVEPYVLGMPFDLFYAAMWSVLTSLFLLIVYLLDPANKVEK